MKKQILFCVLAMAATTGMSTLQVKAAPPSYISVPICDEDKIVAQVLTQAAPEFELTVPAMFAAYEDGLVSIEPDSSEPGVYLVTYGGIGIQIVIDAT